MNPLINEQDVFVFLIQILLLFFLFFLLTTIMDVKYIRIVIFTLKINIKRVQYTVNQM